PRAALPAPALLLAPGRSRNRDHHPPTPPGSDRRRPRRRRPDHRPPPRTTGQQGALGGHHLAYPLPPGTGHAPASQAAPVLSAPLRGRAPQPDVAGGHHPLVPGRWPPS